jgi:hypothetical protein
MVKSTKSNFRQNRNTKGSIENRARASKINASTLYETCSEQLSPFGGLLAMIKFLDLLGFEQLFDSAYQAPERNPKLGHYKMVIGILMLLFIGFNRIWHFTYIRLDAMLCGFFRLARLPVASTFWRYVDHMGINQGLSLIKVMSALRERVWKQLGLNYYRIHIDIDTTVETLYGNQQGGRKGHNTKHRGKKGYRPVLCFIAQTREYMLGKLRKGETISGKQTADFILKIKANLPGCVKQVLLRADGEFFSWESIAAARTCGFDFIIANKRGNPPFDPANGIVPGSAKTLSTTAVFISRRTGRRRAGLWPCAYRKKLKPPARTSRFSVRFLKTTATPIGYFAPALAAALTKLLPSMISGPMWKTLSVKPSEKDWKLFHRPSSKTIMPFFNW